MARTKALFLSNFCRDNAGHEEFVSLLCDTNAQLTRIPPPQRPFPPLGGVQRLGSVIAREPNSIFAAVAPYRIVRHSESMTEDTQIFKGVRRKRRAEERVNPRRGQSRKDPES